MASAALALLLAGTFAGAASAEPAKGQADLRLTISYGQGEYPPGADLAATVTVENVGTAAAEGLKFDLRANYEVSPEEYEKAKDVKRLEPGQRHTAVVVGRQRNTNEVTATFFGRVDVDGAVDPTPADNEFTAKAAIGNSLGAVNGTVYVDADRDGKVDAGEGKAGIEFTSTGGSPVVSLKAVTDGDGRFSFRNVPAGTHRLRFGGAGGFVVKPGSSVFTVESGKETLLELGAVRPVSEALTAKLDFEKDGYGKSDQVGLAVTLTNRGTEALTGVVAVCRSEADHLLPGTGPGWAPLAPGGPGVRVGAGETEVVRVTDVVPDGAYDSGAVAARCAFGDNGEFTDGYAEASDRADVVGATGDVKGDIRHGDQPLVGVGLVALHPRTRALLGRTTSGADGAWSIKGLPAGDVNVVALGPWKDAGSGGIDHVVPIRRGADNVLALSVVPGPVVADPEADPELGATIAFTADTFAPDADATLKITLTNRSDAPMTVVARCVDGGDLRNDTDAWGALKLDGPGVDLAADGTKTVDVTTAIPQAARDRGEVVVRCSFGAKVGTAFVTAEATAKVAVAPTTTTTTPPTTTTTSTQNDGDENENLAYTGASVIGISLLGVLVLALGLGAVLLGRRRRKSD